ncbi:MAG: TIGR00282 family metallophosphoesterase [Bryobacterales bacterium]|nr:TIGR00282 family metallophosphoesterase [Bryobacterales bacterium]
MKLLFIGDIFASAGRHLVADHLDAIVAQHAIDLVIANGENSAGGFGITPQIADELFKLGIDVITTGNHVWDRREIYPYIANQPRLLRPANYPAACPGKGMVVCAARNGVNCAVINLQGRTYMASTDCPFARAEQLLAELDGSIRVRFVDFHAEVTSEKMAMGWFLDGRVSAMVGTHTHVPTADTRILPGGTAYQTDCGMTGPYDSIIGVEREAVLNRFQTAMPVRMEAARDNPQLHSVLVDVDELTGRARTIERVVRPGKA